MCRWSSTPGTTPAMAVAAGMASAQAPFDWQASKRPAVVAVARDGVPYSVDQAANRDALHGAKDETLLPSRVGWSVPRSPPREQSLPADEELSDVSCRVATAPEAVARIDRHGRPDGPAPDCRGQSRDPSAQDCHDSAEEEKSGSANHDVIAGRERHTRAAFDPGHSKRNSRHVQRRLWCSVRFTQLMSIWCRGACSAWEISAR